jgi:hypothetical protein
MGLKNRSKKVFIFAICTQNFSKTFKSKKKREKNSEKQYKNSFWGI